MKDLTKAEEQIMQALWKIETGFAKDIIEAIEGHQPAYNTVLTMLRILVEKEFVKYEAFGKAFRYTPIYSKDEYSKHRLDGLKTNYFEGSSANMLSFLIKEEKMNLEELEDILKNFKK
jgi:predicted transcriptional regulator